MSTSRGSLKVLLEQAGPNQTDDFLGRLHQMDAIGAVKAEQEGVSERVRKRHLCHVERVGGPVGRLRMRARVDAHAVSSQCPDQGEDELSRLRTTRAPRLAAQHELDAPVAVRLALPHPRRPRALHHGSDEAREEGDTHEASEQEAVGLDEPDGAELDVAEQHRRMAQPLALEEERAGFAGLHQAHGSLEAPLRVVECPQDGRDEVLDIGGL